MLPREAPEAYIPSDRRYAIAADRRLPERSQGTAMFADISGFTALTEALASYLGGHRASEELTRHLNRVFHALIAEVDRFGGSVIYFSGDAITCWFDGDDGIRAAAAAFAMQDAMDAARPGYFDDWLSVAFAARDLSDDRFDDYVAALTAAGPLIPVPKK